MKFAKTKRITAAVLGGLMCLNLAACKDGENSSSADAWNGILINDGKPLTLLVDINGLMPVTFDELKENNRNFKRLSAGKEEPHEKV